MRRLLFNWRARADAPPQAAMASLVIFFRFDMVNTIYHEARPERKGHLPFPGIGQRTIPNKEGMAMGKKQAALWLDAARKRQMGIRIASEIRRAGTNKNQLAEKIGCSRQTLHYACKDGTISVELLTEVARLIGASLDYLVYGKHPTADPEFLSLIDKLRDVATSQQPPQL